MVKRREFRVFSWTGIFFGSSSIHSDRHYLYVESKFDLFWDNVVSAATSYQAA
ncbi:hypothetical protein OLMES_4962 [Oleiphilus messinensis]|uniref:Uncharacterized protein n=1 Tax=Oleiphilus messinensis TaxID=141451 RepID=A0A1Y0IFC3_9GAMM|nr:hypothetical protein OLMES_4962 [Oleiphilus messinensis]